jgi:predicted metal-dependent HD superfamily phosphohydrolase
LVTHYGFGEDNSGRYYHSMAHVNALLGLCATHRAALRQPDLVELAIFFHEFVFPCCSAWLCKH